MLLEHEPQTVHTYIHTHYLTTPSRGLFRANGNKYKQHRNFVKNPSWWGADQLAIYKAWRS